MAKEQVEKTPVVLGCVLYTDGGAYQDKKIGGMGVHGYVYQLVPPVRGAGLQGYVLTENGYKVKGPEDDPKGTVDPLHYVDWCGSQETGATNNTAELGAFSKALSYVLAQGLNKLTIVADSEYVLNGINKLDEYRANGWVKQDGGVLKNLSFWQEIDEKLSQLKALNTELNFLWTKGHNGEPGNVKADTLATIGLAYAGKRKTTPGVKESDPSGYWKAPWDYNRLLLGTHFAVFLPGSPITQENKQNRYYLYTDMSAQAGIETFGTPSPNASYAIVDTSEPQTLLDDLVRTQEKLALTRDNPVMMVRIGNVYSKDTASLITDFADMALYETNDGIYCGQKKTADLFHVSYNAMQGLTFFEHLESVFDNYATTPSVFRVIDVTDKLFSTTVTEGKKGKEDKVTTKFTPEDETPYIRFELPDDPYQRKVTLVYGMGLPPLNALKAAAKGHPKVELILTDEGNGVLRYYASVTTDEGKGIWHNPFMCALLPVKPATKKR